MLKCEFCGFPIPAGVIEWMNMDGELRPFHTGHRYDPASCAYKARKQKEYKDRESFTTEVNYTHEEER